MPAVEVQRWHRYFLRYGGDTRTHFLLATLILLVSRALAGKKASHLTVVEIAPWLESETDRMDRIEQAQHNQAVNFARMVESAFDAAGGVPGDEDGADG